VEKKYGEIILVEKMGVRKTAYVVDNFTSAFYVLIQYRGIGETILEMEKSLKNTDEVLKFLSTKITSKTPPRIPVHRAAPAESPSEAPAPEPAEVPPESPIPENEAENTGAAETSKEASTETRE